MPPRIATQQQKSSLVALLPQACASLGAAGRGFGHDLGRQTAPHAEHAVAAVIPPALLCSDIRPIQAVPVIRRAGVNYGADQWLSSP
jgi:hypothetical protein